MLIGKIPNGLKVDLDGFKIIRASDSKPSERLFNGGAFTQLKKIKSYSILGLEILVEIIIGILKNPIHP